METNTAKIAKAFVIFNDWTTNNNQPKYLNPEDFNVHYHNYVKNFGGRMLNEAYNIFIEEYLPELKLEENG